SQLKKFNETLFRIKNSMIIKFPQKIIIKKKNKIFKFHKNKKKNNIFLNIFVIQKVVFFLHKKMFIFFKKLNKIYKIYIK
ncbi:hypothetical protein ACNQOS_19415, partial [Acinetobacter calcoaceticus]